MKELSKFPRKFYSTTALATRTLSGLFAQLENIPQESIRARLDVAKNYREFTPTFAEITHLQSLLSHTPSSTLDSATQTALVDFRMELSDRLRILRDQSDNEAGKRATFSKH
ncbi:MAG TPA: hypothetical protein VGV92_07575 [Gammaproteobacteria bacterium]|nr:hypothetical protein [Gammaproteobacteria bacterium]